MITGVHEDISMSSLKSKYQGVDATREFVSGERGTSDDLRPLYDAQASASWSAGLIPFVSIKTRPTDTASGRYDSRFRDLAIWLAGKPDTYFIWYHEPEDNMSGSTFSSAFNRVRSTMKSVNANVKVGYSAMAYQWGSGRSSTSSPSAWRVQADFYGCDTYSGGSVSSSLILPEHSNHMRWYNELVAKTTGARDKWGLTERGWKSGTDSARASNIRRETAWLSGLTATSTVTKPQFYLYWNTTGTENDPNLINGPQATQALKELIATL